MSKFESEFGRQETAREVEARAALSVARRQQDAAEAAVRQAMTELQEARYEGDQSLPQATVVLNKLRIPFVIVRRTSTTIWARPAGAVTAPDMFRLSSGYWCLYPRMGERQYIHPDSPGLHPEGDP